VKVVVKDAYGNVWKEATATSVAGLNVFEYDLTADLARADAAEADLKKRGEAKAQAQEEMEKKFAPPKGAPEAGAKKGDDADDDEEGAEAAKTDRPLPPDLEAALADPFRSRRTRYLPPGTYTVEISAAGMTATTKLEVRKPKAESLPEDAD
jgi:hypothetical protein